MISVAISGSSQSGVAVQLLESLDQADPEQSAWLQKVASRGDVTGSAERATTGRSDKRT